MSEDEIGILDLLRLKGFDPTKRVRLVRHQDARWDMQELLRRGWLETYQAFQARPVFDDLDSIVSFVGVGGTRARLEGVYDVLGREPSPTEPTLPPGMTIEFVAGAPYYYRLRRVDGFKDLENRVVIDWGTGTRSWVQRLRNKRVIEVLSAGQLLRPFTDYLGFTLTRTDLEYLGRDPEANREWRARLSAVAGVYLILDKTTGKQYVGSAHGVDGVWGRWMEYVRDGHGGNTRLRELMKCDPETYPAAFCYSILQILPRTATRSEVLKWERLYKEKLGSRAVGLNDN